MIQHGTCVALPHGESLRGVLLLGPSGAGKSDLALRLIDSCPERKARLVADDQTVLTAQDGHVIAAAAPRIAGLLEVRGLGVIAVPTAPSVVVDLVVQCAPESVIDRVPVQCSETLCGIDVAAVGIRPFEASAPAKVRLALVAVIDGLFRGDTALSEAPRA